MPVKTKRSNSRLQAGLSGLGGGGFERAHIVEVQRARMLAAMVDVVIERGLAGATVARVVTRSGVSRRTFYEIFEDREDCFLAALDDAIARAQESVLGAGDESAGRWRERVRAGLTGLLRFFDDQPGIARLLIVESLGAGPAALERRRRVLDRLIAVVDEGRGEARARREISGLTAEGVVGAVSSVIHARLLAPPRTDGRERCSLVGLVGPLMSMIVLPYLGPVAAQKEIERPVPKPLARSRVSSGGDPLRGLGLRLTYRTVRVVMAIGAQPGVSNRQVGLVAEVADQGQISKLLARLAGRGLIENTGEGQARGAPNAWSLTARGREVEDAILEQATRS